ncbi:tyrosine-type recombinase/integrase [Paenisporosarcina sp. TG20]|uniref:tyrosine-type recombinase/integrase n=1 Tax=Paenisporosarcina sp. TG20 TaxID=1211706 RepID=UPI00350F42BC
MGLLSSSDDIMRKETVKNRVRHYNRKLHVDQKNDEISERYAGDIRQYLDYCLKTDQSDGTEAMLDYLYGSLMEQKVKKTTWERRLAAIKKHLAVTQRIDFKREAEVTSELSAMRRIYGEEGNADLIRIQGKSSVNKTVLLNMICKLPSREKAICLVNLITANRPNEMVRMKVKDFNLKNQTVDVYLMKQKKWHTKRLTQEAVNMVMVYIREYQLRYEDYFVGRVYKGGRYESVEMSVTGYWKSLQRWTGLSGYNFRKSQVVAMHTAGADLSTIAKQTGHKSLETLVEHYLTVSDSTVDKYL